MTDGSICVVTVTELGFVTITSVRVTVATAADLRSVNMAERRNAAVTVADLRSACITGARIDVASAVGPK
jgi:hypothetical protein